MSKLKDGIQKEQIRFELLEKLKVEGRDAELYNVTWYVPRTDYSRTLTLLLKINRWYFQKGQHYQLWKGSMYDRQRLNYFYEQYANGDKKPLTVRRKTNDK